MQNVVKRAILERCRTFVLVLMCFVSFAGAAELTMVVHAQEAQKDAKPADKVPEGEDKKGPGGLFDNPILPLLIVMVLFFFFIILPAQRRQKKEQESVLANLKKNDEVVTAAGIIGIVSLIKDNEDEVTLKIDDNARIKVLKSSIVRIRNKEAPADAATNPPPSTPPNTNIKA